MALLRTIREVLKKVDCKSSNIDPALKKEISGFLSRMADTKPEPRIYWEFICRDANNILHEYKFSAIQSVVRQPDDSNKPIESGVSAKTTNDSYRRPPREGRTQPTYLMKSGSYKGRDQRELVREAIDWWQREIEEMLQRAAGQALKKPKE